MNNVCKFLLLAFSLGITCLLISTFGRVADAGFKTSDKAIDRLDDFNNSLSESDIMMYDGQKVVGSDVVNFIKKTLGPYDKGEDASIYVYVSTSMACNTYSDGGFIKDIQDFSSDKYIKPIANFSCSVIRNANGVIDRIEFSQI